MNWQNAGINFKKKVKGDYWIEDFLFAKFYNLTKNIKGKGGTPWIIIETVRSIKSDKVFNKFHQSSVKSVMIWNTLEHFELFPIQQRQ